MNNNMENENEFLFKKVTHLPNNPVKNNLLDNFNKSKKKYLSKRVKIILPNISNSTIINSNNNKEVNVSYKNNNTIKDYNSKKKINNSNDRSEIYIKIKPHLKKNISFPSLKNHKINNLRKINNYKGNLNNKEYSPNNILNNNNNQSYKKINKNILFPNKSVRLEKQKINLTNNMYKNLDISKSTIYNNNNKDITQSTFQISKIRLNETISDRKLYKKLNTSLSCNNISDNRTFLRKNDSIIKIPKYSKFFKISKNDTISAKRIYRHYLKKSAGEVVKPIRNYKRFFDDRSQTFLEKLSRIYCESQNFLSIIKELKDNNKLAFKDDFNIEEYQSTIIELMNQRLSQKHLLDLQNDYRVLNKKLNGIVEPKGRFTILAEKLRYNLPLYLLEKLKQLDKDSILTRMRYYNKFKKFKSENKLINRFEVNPNKRKKV